MIRLIELLTRATRHADYCRCRHTSRRFAFEMPRRFDAAAEEA